MEDYKLFDKSNTGVIVACDVNSKDELFNLVNETTDVNGIVGYKIGFMLGTGEGLKNIVPEMKEYTNKPIIYDHQKAGTDIPAMGENFGKLMGDSGVDAAIIFPQAGPSTQKAYIDGISNNDVIPIGGGEMTHPNFLLSAGGYIDNSAPKRMYELFLNNNVIDFVVPGNKPEAIKRYIDGPFRNFKHKIAFHSPGHGKQGGVLSKAIEASFPVRYFGIVGSGIYKKENIRKAATKWAEEAINTWDKLEDKVKEVN